jgi:hypothetical protein
MLFEASLNYLLRMRPIRKRSSYLTRCILKIYRATAERYFMMF